MSQKLILLVPFLLLALATGVFAALPAPWKSQDIGTTGGSANESGGTFTIIGDGADIWDSSDGFHYCYQQLPGGVILKPRDPADARRYCNATVFSVSWCI